MSDDLHDSGAPPRDDHPGPVLVLPEPSPREFDPALHDRMRLGIVVALALNDRAAFTDLRDALGMTDGNLSLHVKRLEEAGYVAGQKTVERRSPRTEYRLTPAGRKAFDRYLAQLEALVHAARSAPGEAPR
jgi:DNA-binding HxlR family transcriptional regulator